MPLEQKKKEEQNQAYQDFYTAKQIQEKLQIGRSTLYGWIADGFFPKPVKFGSAARWPKAPTDKWITEKINQAA